MRSKPITWPGLYIRFPKSDYINALEILLDGLAQKHEIINLFLYAQMAENCIYYFQNMTQRKQYANKAI